jgi:thiol:disulfide interchange protein DsbD
MKKMLNALSLVLGIMLCLAFLLAGDHAHAAISLPYRFHTEWAKLSAVDGRKLDSSLDKNISMAVLWMLPEPGYHTYAHIPGEDGIPLTVAVLADGDVLPSSSVQVRYTPGTETPVTSGGFSYVHKRAVPVFLLFQTNEEKAVTLDISFLACSDKHCQPIHTRILLPSAPPELKNAAQLPWFDALMSSKDDPHQNIPQEVPPVIVSDLPEASLPYPSLLPEAPTSVFQKRIARNTAPSVPVPSAEPKNSTYGYQFTPTHLEGTFEIDSWLRAIGLGLLAGLILNIMPCVLPVLTMKFSILLDTDDSPEQRARTIREHTIFFAAGIIAWFTLLAIISGLTGILWGQMFQSSEAIFLMMLIVFCMGLSMFDVFHLPVLDLQMHHSSSPKMQAFSTGMFTTLLATPCSGPLLGGVLAWGMTKPLPVLVTIFAATGVGMALPYCILAGFPRLVYFLPKPGVWLNVLERILGFMLMGTAI